MQYVNSKPPTIERRRLIVVEIINDAIDRYRQSSPCGVIQHLVYQEKVEQSMDYAASNFSDDVSEFPLLLAEADLMGMCVKDIAQLVIEKRRQWNGMIIATELLRQRYLQLTSSATDLSQLDNIPNQLSAELDAIDIRA